MKHINKIYKQYSKTHNVLVKTTESEYILAFIYNNNGTHIHIPLPDFTLIYYDFAYKLNSNRKEQEKKLFKKLSNLKSLSENVSNELYGYYGLSSSCVINLFTSIEAFSNHLLPHDYKYKVEKSNRTEVYNRKQIQEQLPFWDKLKKVIPEFTGKNFFDKHTPTNQHIYNLKDIRDELIHIKSKEDHSKVIDLFKKLLKFKYEKTFMAVSKFMNYYKPKYIESCPCDTDF